MIGTAPSRSRVWSMTTPPCRPSGCDSSSLARAQIKGRRQAEDASGVHMAGALAVRARISSSSSSSPCEIFGCAPDDRRPADDHDAQRLLLQPTGAKPRPRGQAGSLAGRCLERWVVSNVVVSFTYYCRSGRAWVGGLAAVESA
jgi:hypothetical protein